MSREKNVKLLRAWLAKHKESKESKGKKGKQKDER